MEKKERLRHVKAELEALVLSASEPAIKSEEIRV